MSRKLTVEYPGAIYHVMRGLLERIEGKLEEHHHSGEIKRESAQAKAKRIIGEERRRRGWEEEALQRRAKSDPEKLAIADRLRRETTPRLRQVAERLHVGSSKSLNNKPHPRRKTQANAAK